MDSSKLHAQDFDTWAQESYDMAKDYVYKGKFHLFAIWHLCARLGFVENEIPDQEYIDRAIPVLEERMVYAGARLAALMVDIYGESAKPVAFLEWTFWNTTNFARFNEFNTMMVSPPSTQASDSPTSQCLQHTSINNTL